MWLPAALVVLNVLGCAPGFLELQGKPDTGIPDTSETGSQVETGDTEDTADSGDTTDTEDTEPPSPWGTGADGALEVTTATTLPVMSWPVAALSELSLIHI